MGDSPLTLRRTRKSRVCRRDSEMAILEQTSENFPKASEAAIHFLQSLDDSDFEQVEFSDRLTTFSDIGKEIGNFSVSIKSSSSNGFLRSFLVEASSIGKIDGMLCGTKIMAHISQNMLETIEHRQHDFLFLKDENLKRDTEIVKQQNGYIINRGQSRGQDVKKTSQLLAKEHTTGLISEAADLILQRLLVLKGLPSDFVAISLDTNGNLAPARYVRLKDTAVENIFGMETHGISRTVVSWEDKPSLWHLYLTLNGRLLYRHRIGSSFCMKLPLGDCTDNTEEAKGQILNCTEFDKTKNEFDAAGSSNGKTKFMVDSKTYLKEHPELNTITTDFLQLLFIHKPSNVPLFAANYFSSLASENETNETTAVGTT